MKKSNGEKDVIKYSLRERPSTNYMDLEVPDDDNYLCKSHVPNKINDQQPY